MRARIFLLLEREICRGFPFTSSFFRNENPIQAVVHSPQLHPPPSTRHTYARHQLPLFHLSCPRPNPTKHNGIALLCTPRLKSPPKRQQTSRRLCDLAASLPRLTLAAIGAAALLCGPAGASDGGGSGTARYHCEDVASYYAGTEGSEGAKLMRRLSGIVSGQRSLPYRKVWDALKILDAANIDDPDNSSDIIEIHSVRAVPKELAGKPEG